jgi:hypothetical protein
MALQRCQVTSMPCSRYWISAFLVSAFLCAFQATAFPWFRAAFLYTRLVAGLASSCLSGWWMWSAATQWVAFVVGQCRAVRWLVR